MGNHANSVQVPLFSKPGVPSLDAPTTLDEEAASISGPPGHRGGRNGTASLSNVQQSFPSCGHRFLHPGARQQILTFWVIPWSIWVLRPLLRALESLDDPCSTPLPAHTLRLPWSCFGAPVATHFQSRCLEAHPGQLLSLWRSQRPKPDLCWLGRRLKAQPTQLWEFPGGGRGVL